MRERRRDRWSCEGRERGLKGTWGIALVRVLLGKDFVDAAYWKWSDVVAWVGLDAAL